MKILAAFEKDIVDAYENSELKSTSHSKLAKFKAAASAVFSREIVSTFASPRQT
ncbi:MAG: hypothetical protein R8K20_00300 [Gallionellaceae bacterium]